MQTRYNTILKAVSLLQKIILIGHLQNDTHEIDVSTLIGNPGCPYCGNISAFAVCGFCEKLMCINDLGKAICPWCNNENNFVSGDGDFSVRRGEG